MGGRPTSRQSNWPPTWALITAEVDISRLVVRFGLESRDEFSKDLCDFDRRFNGQQVAFLRKYMQRRRRIGYIGEVSTPPWMFVDSSGRTTTVPDPCRFSANSTSMMLEVALAGFGIAYGPSFVFARHLQTGELIHTLPDFKSPELPLHAITPTAKHVPQKARLFIERLTQAFEDSPPWERWRTNAIQKPGSLKRRRRGK